jgi:hypothetical protein
VTSEETVEVFLVTFPECKHLYSEHINDYGELLEHVFYSEVINHPLSELLKTNKDTAQIQKYINFVELMWSQGDETVQNVVDVTILEYLSDDEGVWKQFGTYISDNFRNYINTELLKQNCAMWHVKQV